MLAGLLHLAFMAGDHFASAGARSEPSFSFRAQGWGLAADAVASVLVITGFAVVYAFGAFFVGRRLGWALRALLFFIFVIACTAIRAESFVAAAVSADSVTLIKTGPLGSQEVALASLRRVAVSDTGLVCVVTIETSDGAYSSLPVWRWDAAARGELYRFVATLRR